MVPYAWACANGSLAGTYVGAVILPLLPLHIPLAVSSAGGFAAGALIGPIAQYLLASSRRESSIEPAESVTIERPPAVIESRANHAIPYAFAATLGGTLACAGGDLIALLWSHVPLHLLSAAGFVLGSLAGVVTQAFIDHWLPGASAPAKAAPRRAGIGRLGA